MLEDSILFLKAVGLQGKILIYNANTGKGKILTRDNSKYEFDIDAWMDYDHMPAVGLVVAFSLINKKATDIRVYDGQNDSPTDDFPVPSQSVNEKGGASTSAQHQSDSARRVPTLESKPSTTQYVRPADPSSPAQKHSLPVGRERAHHSEETAVTTSHDLPVNRIKMTKDVVECMNEHLDEYLETVQQNSRALAMNKSIDFFRMRRFLNTAFHNLKQIDRSISNEAFKKIENELKSMQQLYENFSKISHQPHEVAFEQIVMRRQPDYITVMKLAKDYREQMEELTGLDRRLRMEIEQTEEKMKKFAHDPAPYRELQRQVKQMKKRYTDVIHGITSSKEKLSLIVRMIEDFKEEYLSGFSQLFEQNIKYYKSKIVKILNTKAYEFDYLLWANAKESPYIRQFFADCKIEGTYSSKTFLKYYVKSLDKDKLTEENRKLLDLLDYLEKSCTKKIVILTKDIDVAETIKVAVESVDKDFYVMASNSPVDILGWSKANHPDLVFIEWQLKLMGALEFVKRFNKDIQGTICDFCLIYGEEDAQKVANSDTRSIRYSLKKPFSQKDLKDRLKEIL